MFFHTEKLYHKVLRYTYTKENPIPHPNTNLLSSSQGEFKYFLNVYDNRTLKSYIMNNQIHHFPNKPLCL
jgi:hypothetical protein